MEKTSTLSEKDHQFFDQVSMDMNEEEAIWSLLLSTGYLKVIAFSNDEDGLWNYELALTNFEIRVMFVNMIHGWFSRNNSNYNDFIKALLAGDMDAMNEYMNQVTLSTFSYFDTGKTPSENVKPEHFYHGFVLSLIVDLSDRYAAILESKGIPSHRIRKYGFAFEGKNVLIGDGIPIQ